MPALLAYSYFLHVRGEPGWRGLVFVFAPLHFLHDHLIKNIQIVFITWLSCKMLLCCILTMPCSGTAAWTLRLTTWAKAGQCWGGLKPLLGSVALVLLVGTLAGWPLVSYTFMCSRLPCLAALCQIKKWWLVSTFSQRSCCFCYPDREALFHSEDLTVKLPRCCNTSALLCPNTLIYTHLYKFFQNS